MSVKDHSYGSFASIVTRDSAIIQSLFSTMVNEIRALMPGLDEESTSIYCTAKSYEQSKYASSFCTQLGFQI